MSRLRSSAAAVLLAAAALASSACYRVTVVTNATPSTVTVDKPWNNSFVYGLVPPAPIDVAPKCTNGVSKVVTQRSFLNSLVGAITYSIYTPLQVNVTCATGARTATLGLPESITGIASTTASR